MNTQKNYVKLQSNIIQFWALLIVNTKNTAHVRNHVPWFVTDQSSFSQYGPLYIQTLQFWAIFLKYLS